MVAQDRHKDKHTPGPWGVEQWGDDTFYVRGGDVVVAPIADLRIPEEEQKANAYLIAASPELLEALETLLAAKEEKDTNGKTLAYIAQQRVGWERADAAIAKARGEVGK